MQIIRCWLSLTLRKRLRRLISGEKKSSIRTTKESKITFKVCPIHSVSCVEWIWMVMIGSKVQTGSTRTIRGKITLAGAAGAERRERVPLRSTPTPEPTATCTPLCEEARGWQWWWWWVGGGRKATADPTPPLLNVQSLISSKSLICKSPRYKHKHKLLCRCLGRVLHALAASHNTHTHTHTNTHTHTRTHSLSVCHTHYKNRGKL